MNFPPILSQKTCFSRKNALFLKKVTKKFGGNKKMPTFAIPNEKIGSPNAEIAQLVEHNLAKVGVASSSLVFRSKTKEVSRNADLLFEKYHPTGFNHMSVVLVYKGRLFSFIEHFFTQIALYQLGLRDYFCS